MIYRRTQSQRAEVENRASVESRNQEQKVQHQTLAGTPVDYKAAPNPKTLPMTAA